MTVQSRGNKVKHCSKCGKAWVFKHNSCAKPYIQRQHKTPHQERLDERWQVQRLMIRAPKDVMLIKIIADPEKQYDIYQTIKNLGDSKEVYVYV